MQCFFEVPVAEFDQLPGFRRCQDLFNQLVIDVVAGLVGTYMAENRITEQAQVADGIKNLVPYKLVLEA